MINAWKYILSLVVILLAIAMFAPGIIAIVAGFLGVVAMFSLILLLPSINPKPSYFLVVICIILFFSAWVTSSISNRTSITILFLLPFVLLFLNKSKAFQQDRTKKILFSIFFLTGLILLLLRFFPWSCLDSKICRPISVVFFPAGETGMWDVESFSREFFSWYPDWSFFRWIVGVIEWYLISCLLVEFPRKIRNIIINSKKKKDILEYSINNLSKGFSKEEIINVFLKQGYEKRLVSNIVEKAEKKIREKSV